MNIILIGDSLIEYFDWQRRFPAHRVWNLGVAGESVEGLLSRVMRVSETCPEADCIFIMSGINNVAMGDLEFLGFYEVIVERLASFYPEAVILVHSLLPTLGDFISNDVIEKANHSLIKLAKKAGAEYVDLYSRFVDARGGPIKEYLLEDGIHLSRTGYEVWAKVIDGLTNRRLV